MSGSLALEFPDGRGHKTTVRQGGAAVAAGVARVASSWSAKPYQRPALACGKGIDLIIGGLGSGKSSVGAFKLLRWALRHPRRRSGAPTKWLLAGPDFSLLRGEQMELVIEAARSLSMPYEAVVRRVVYGADPRLYLAHGQQIVCRSGTEPNRMRGHQFDGGWLDEGEQMPEEAFGMALSRQRSAAAIRLVVTSSPLNVRASWLWPLINGESEAYNKLRDNVELRVHRWKSEQNDANEAEVLAAIEAALEARRAGSSKQELEGLFLGGEVAEAAALDHGRAFIKFMTLTPEEATAQTLGVDLGRSQDFSWLTVLSRTGVVLAMERFNVSTPGVPRDSFYPYVENRILDLVETWKLPLVKVDTAMHGASFAESLARALGERARVDGYRTDSPRRKAEALEALGVALSRGQLRIPRAWSLAGGKTVPVDWVDQLARELSELVVSEKQGFRTFDHPQGGHDDGIVSLALAWHGLSSQAQGPLMADLSALLVKPEGRPDGAGGSPHGGRGRGYTF